MPERARAGSALPDRRMPWWHHLVAATVALAVALIVVATPAPETVPSAESPETAEAGGAAARSPR